MNFCKYFTLWLFNIAMENGPFMDEENLYLPIENGDLCHSYVE
jgi:hypothetical protein